MNNNFIFSFLTKISNYAKQLKTFNLQKAFDASKYCFDF